MLPCSTVVPLMEDVTLVRTRAAVETGAMLLQEDRTDRTLEETLALALGEFCPAWKIASDCSPVDPLDPSHWAADTQSFQVTLRHRVTGRRKALGRRTVDEPSTSLYRGVALSLIEAYRRGNADPMRRYLEEIGVAETKAQAPGHFFHRAELLRGDVGVSGSAPRSGVSASWRLIVGRPKWPSLVTVTLRWRRETPRPALPDTAAGSGAEEATGERRSGTLLPIVLMKLRRDFELWQWRRTYKRRHQ